MMINAPWILSFVFWTTGTPIPTLQNIKKYLLRTDQRQDLKLKPIWVYQKYQVKSSLFENSFKLSQMSKKKCNSLIIVKSL